MNTPEESDTGFVDSVPVLYRRYMVPLIFEPYANDLATRVRALAPTDVLEVAAGSGVVTRALAVDIEGTPLRAEVEALDRNGLAAALEVSAAALTQRFGSVDPVGKIRGFVVTATKSGLLPTVQSGFLADIEPRE